MLIPFLNPFSYNLNQQGSVKLAWLEQNMSSVYIIHLGS